MGRKLDQGERVLGVDRLERLQLPMRCLIHRILFLGLVCFRDEATFIWLTSAVLDVDFDHGLTIIIDILSFKLIYLASGSSLIFRGEDLVVDGSGLRFPLIKIVHI